MLVTDSALPLIVMQNIIGWSESVLKLVSDFWLLYDWLKYVGNRGVMPIQSDPSDFWSKWILNAASKRQNIAD